MIRLFVAFVLCGMMMSAFAQDVRPKPDNLTLTVMRLADPEEQNQYVFVVTGVRPVAFKTLDGLKTYLRNRPKNVNEMGRIPILCMAPPRGVEPL